MVISGRSEVSNLKVAQDINAQKNIFQVRGAEVGKSSILK